MTSSRPSAIRNTAVDESYAEASAPTKSYIQMGGFSSSRRWNNKSSTIGGDGLVSTTTGGLAQTDNAVCIESFFASIRVPASFLAGASFTQLFGLQSEDDNQQDGIQRFLMGVCITFMGISFLLSLLVIILSSSALTRSLAENYDTFAENGYELLFREFHFEFVSVRWSFMVSLFGFVVAVTSRFLVEYKLFGGGPDDQSNRLGIAVCFITASLLLHLTSYVNSTLIGWNNMGEMTIDLIKLVIQRVSWTKPCQIMSCTMLILGVVFIILELLPNGDGGQDNQQ